MTQTPPADASSYPTLADTAAAHAAAMPELVAPTPVSSELLTSTPLQAEPGWQTTEFWIATGTEVVGALVTFGVVSQATGLRITGLVVQGVTIVGYAIARGIRKQGTAG